MNDYTRAADVCTQLTEGMTIWATGLSEADRQEIIRMVKVFFAMPGKSTVAILFPSRTIETEKLAHDQDPGEECMSRFSGRILVGRIARMMKTGAGNLVFANVGHGGQVYTAFKYEQGEWSELDKVNGYRIVAKCGMTAPGVYKSFNELQAYAATA